MLASITRHESSVEFGDVHLEVSDVNWPQAVELQDCREQSLISLSLSPRPAHSQICYGRDNNQEPFADVGDLLFLPAGIPFHGRSQGGHQRLLIFRFDQQHLLSLPHVSHWPNSALRAALDLRDNHLRSSLLRLAHEVTSPGQYSENLIPALVTTALIDLSRCLERHLQTPENLPRGGLAPWQLRRIRERIECTDAAPPTVDELASLCGISARHAMRGFKQSSGSTLYQAIDAARLNHARHLLRDTDLPLKTIAWQLGFAHASSFTAAFQRALGMPPTHYRSQFIQRPVTSTQ